MNAGIDVQRFAEALIAAGVAVKELALSSSGYYKVTAVFCVLTKNVAKQYN